MNSEILVIVHFAPVEFYPPVQNLLQELIRRGGNHRIVVLTTRAANSELDKYRPRSSRVKIIRLGATDKELGATTRYAYYFHFYAACLLLLAWYRPKRVMYFETISAWPVYFYSRFVASRSKILAHYHEYTSEQEYASGMKLTRYFHNLEKWVYPRAIWVSHTNEARMDRFRKDVFPVEVSYPQIVPNYPPLAWKVQPRCIATNPLRIVYVGALSLNTMYVKEFARWINEKHGRILWDIYSFNFTSEAERFLRELSCPWISLLHGVEYDKLSNILPKYDVGVILYKGHIPNYILNAPNKLFEYLACGLNVWLPSVMTGSLSYCTQSSYPVVVAVDFGSMDEFDYNSHLHADSSVGRDSEYFSEFALAPLVDKLLEI